MATAGAVLGGYALHVVAARWLATAEYGRFVLVLSIITWAEGFHGAALSGPGKVLSEDHRRLSAALGMACKWFLPSGLVGGLLLLAAAPLIASGLGDQALVGFLALAAVEIPLTGLFRMTARFSGVMRRYGVSSAIKMVYNIGRSALGCALIVLGLGAMGGLAGQILATALAAGLGVLLLLRAGRGLPRVEYPPMLRRSFSWAGYSMIMAIGLNTLIAMDLWMVKGLLADPALAGVYGAAFALARTPKFLMQALAPAVFPRVSQALAQGQAALAASVSREAFRVVIIVFVPLCVLVGESSTEIIDFVFSERYVAAGPPLMVLMVAISVFSFYQLMLSLLAAADRPGLRAAFVLALVPVGLVMNLLLIPAYGVVGAAAATLVTMIIGVLSIVWLVRGLTGAGLPCLSFLRCGISGGIVYAAARLWSAEGWVIIPRLAALGLAYVGILFILRELGRKEIRSVTGVLPPKLRARITNALKLQ
ncbi:MAG: lipopolysaccharide biosynthesis protein [Lentisphaeria bacterium]